MERAVRLDRTIAVLRWLGFLGILGLGLFGAGEHRFDISFYLPTIVFVLYNSAFSYLAFSKNVHYHILMVASSLATALDILIVTLLVLSYSFVFNDIYLFYGFVIIDVALRFGPIGGLLSTVMVCMCYAAVSAAGSLAITDQHLYNAIGRLVFFFVLGLGISYFSREVHTEREKRTELAALYETSQVASVTLDLKEILSFVVAKALEHFRAAGTAVLLIDKDTGQLRVAETRGRLSGLGDTASMVSEDGVEGRVARTGQAELHPRPKRSLRRLLLERGHKSRLCVPLVSRGSTVGVLTLESDGNRERFDENDLKLATTFASQAATSIENIRLYHDLRQLALSTMTALASAIDAKDSYTRGHSERLANYAVGLAQHLGLPESERRSIECAATLHDIGKIAISDSILKKAGPLTAEEWSLMRTHPVRGAQMVESIDFLRDAVPLILHHHERYDGKGYPAGLAGEDIPLGARVLAVVDAWEAMTSDRAYRRALTYEQAAAELVRNAGKQFDPHLVTAFLSWLQKGRAVAEHQAREPKPNAVARRREGSKEKRAALAQLDWGISRK